MVILTVECTMSHCAYVSMRKTKEKSVIHVSKVHLTFLIKIRLKVLTSHWKNKIRIRKEAEKKNKKKRKQSTAHKDLSPLHNIRQTRTHAIKHKWF